MVDIDAKKNLAMYTRGGPDMPETRGESMVQKHAEKLQKEKEDAAMGAVRNVVSGVGPAVCAVALQESDWDAQKAILLLQRFKSAQAQELDAIHKAKRKETAAGIGNKEGSDAGSSSESESAESGSESDGSADAIRHKKSKRSRSSKSKEKKRKKKTAKEHRSKKRKRRSKRSAKEEDRPVGQFGKYGIIKETDFQAKRADFACWALEVKHIDPETLPKFEEKELFKSFMEDYNTATLPHKKYYDMQAYEQKKAAKAAKHRKVSTGGERMLFNDEEEKHREAVSSRMAAQQARLRQAYDELKYTDKAQDMREQELLRMKMSLAYKTGDHATAEKLAERLRPDDQKDTRRDRDPVV